MLPIILLSTGLIVVLTLLYALGLYNKFVELKTLVAEGLSTIDVALKQRADLIPNLVSTVKGYAVHEQQVLTDVTRMRASALHTKDVGEKAANNAAFEKALMQLLAVQENYPALKADAAFMRLQEELSDLEETIEASRRYYNATVREYNILAKSFPSNIVANVCAFGEKPFFEAADADKVAPTVAF
jgi:LemA protein